MKIFIAVLTFAAIAVNAQSPFDTYFSNIYNRPQNTPLQYQSYDPYQISTTTRRPYFPVVTTQAPTFSPSKSPIISRQPYNNYQTSITTRRPYIAVVSTQSPTSASLYNSPYLAAQGYNTYQISSETSRPYVPTGTSQAPTVSSSNAYIGSQPYQLYQTSISTRRPYIPSITSQNPTTTPPYNAPYKAPKPYRPYQSSTTTSRPYIPFVSNTASTTAPLYNVPYRPYNPYQTSTTTPYIPYAPTTVQPYRPPSFVDPAAVYYNGDARLANTLRSENQINPDGSYRWLFETDNGIVAQAQGSQRNVASDPSRIANDVQGAFSWTAPNGVLISYTYTADEYGYHPKRAYPGAKS